MKKTLWILFLVFLPAQTVQAASIYEFLGIRGLTQVYISVYPPGDRDRPEKGVMIKDRETLGKIEGFLRQLPSTGDVYKDFGNVRFIKVELTGSEGTVAVLSIYGTRLRVPDDSGAGTFYAGPTDVESKFVGLIESLVAGG